MSEAGRTCSRCGAALTAGLGCAACLLNRGLDTEAPRTIGGYEVQGELGRGRMGIVYRARDPRLGRTVALKTCRTSSADESARLLADAQAASRLDHPNIVPVHGYGEDEGSGEAYVVMRLLEGGSLADRTGAPAADVRWAASTMATLARAVHHCHERDVIHRDLKPSNILFDEAGQPFVADFGIARRLDVAERLTESGMVLGTPVYMAPEQARGGEATRTSDVYGLGAILYELLTGRPPFVGETLADTFRQIEEDEPPPPRAFNARVNADLQAICLACLEKAPARRYASADLLAQDLDRYLRGEPTVVRPPGPARRAWKWALRHPVASGAGLVLLIAATTALWASLEQEARSRHELLAANAYAARLAANNVLLQLRGDADAFLARHYADQVQRPAQDPALVALLEAKDLEGLRMAPLPRGASVPRGLSPFETWLVTDVSGTVVARWPAPVTGSPPQDASRLDFFVGARAIAQAGKRTVHVSRLFRDDATGQLRFAHSTPIYGRDGAFIGAVAALVAPATVAGALRLDAEGDRSRSAALLAPVDPAQTSGSSRWAFLFHEGHEGPGLAEFEPRVPRGVAALGRPALSLVGQQLRPAEPERVRTAEDYRDPLPGHGGRWLAGFAPVGDTGFVVVVQTRYAAVLQPIARALQRVALPLLLLALGGLVAVALRRGTKAAVTARRALGGVIASSLAIGVAVALWPTGAAPGDAPAEDPSSTPVEPLLVGEVASLTGPEAEFGQSTRNGVELAIAQANADGGVAGRPVALRVYDDQSSPEGAARVLRRLLEQDRVVAVLGEATSANSLAMAPIAQAARVPMVTPASTNPGVTAAGDFVFRACFSDAFQGLAMARFAREDLKLERVAVLTEAGSAYSEGLGSEFAARFQELRGTVVSRGSYAKGSTDFRAPLQAARDAGAQAVYLPGYVAEVVRIAEQARQLGAPWTLLGGDGWDSEQLFETGGGWLEGAYLTSHYSPHSPGIEDFVGAYQRAFGALPDAYAALAYDAGRLLIDALRRAPAASGPALRDALAATSGFRGVTGDIRFDGQRNAIKPAVVLRIEGGRFQLVRTVSP